METFPEVASAALQAFSGLLAQQPFPLSAERLCYLLTCNMFIVDRAAVLTRQHVQPPSGPPTAASTTVGISSLTLADKNKE
ncbi:unnamed protein product [Protopolystoma xenopodis]|uniref:Uncharacterized protein n=1 Tax=Protopolystoma xenopodis TaxID=117903 RepID=A0A448X5M8_9PLAT|nr:unnamed protein product [Protopolystoma xenopodis]